MISPIRKSALSISVYCSCIM